MYPGKALKHNFLFLENPGIGLSRSWKVLEIIGSTSVRTLLFLVPKTFCITYLMWHISKALMFSVRLPIAYKIWDADYGTKVCKLCDFAVALDVIH